MCMKLKIPQATSRGFIEVQMGGAFDYTYPGSKTRRGRVQDGGKVSPTLCSTNENILIFNDMAITRTRPEGKGWVWDDDKQRWFRVRKLTPVSCGRIMDVDEEYIERMMSMEINNKGKEVRSISNSQLYKCFGNSIVVSCLELIFEQFYFPKTEDFKQLTLF